MNTKFIELVRDQYSYGGHKYASTNTKEATDELVEDFGWNWLIGTQAKYVKRYKNTKREKDLLKIACYQYINWLKLGYHLAPLGTAEMHCTTVTTKEKFFDAFIYEAYNFGCANHTQQSALDKMYDLILKLKLEKNANILYEIFTLCEYVWLLDGFDKVDEHSTDTWNEGKSNGEK